MSVEQERLSDAWAPPWVRHEHLARYLFARDLLVEGSTVAVDCACGDGTSSVIFAERARHVWAFDIDPDAITTAREQKAVANVQYGVADAVALPLPAATAHAFVSFETIEHLADDEAFLREVVRVLDPSGFFVCSTPDREVYSPGNGPADTPWNEFHVHEYAPDEFVALLSRHFARVEMYGQNEKRRGITAAKHRLARMLPEIGRAHV